MCFNEHTMIATITLISVYLNPLAILCARGIVEAAFIFLYCRSLFIPQSDRFKHHISVRIRSLKNLCGGGEGGIRTLTRCVNSVICDYKSRRVTWLSHLSTQIWPGRWELHPQTPLARRGALTVLWAN